MLSSVFIYVGTYICGSYACNSITRKEIASTCQSLVEVTSIDLPSPVSHMFYGVSSLAMQPSWRLDDWVPYGRFENLPVARLSRKKATLDPIPPTKFCLELIITTCCS